MDLEKSWTYEQWSIIMDCKWKDSRKAARKWIISASGPWIHRLDNYESLLTAQKLDRYKEKWLFNVSFRSQGCHNPMIQVKNQLPTDAPSRVKALNKLELKPVTRNCHTTRWDRASMQNWFGSRREWRNDEIHTKKLTHWSKDQEGEPPNTS
jgi:hypothetical protein